MNHCEQALIHFHGGTVTSGIGRPMLERMAIDRAIERQGARVTPR